ncbi:MAG: sugar ABC transporter permease [Mesorhizobium sp.]|uniref:carbohydrate ABC transporter permease n=1 Tax=Mesorhizobium sp. TaxID=1871066 RepID=UPI00120A7413|nr:sugar ABC transporter permease [Mesorhizobium sp.]TIS97509.1 MAG: sugar ABC transporter permease [Mesorhizobium sp.]TIT54565.1 MAG: sugar ABC transporter permease [Mesorhizobium sp.]
MRTWLHRQTFRPDMTVVFFFGIVAVFFYGSILWTGYMSLTRSTLMPNYNFVGFDQYIKLFTNHRWLVSCLNMVIFGVLYIVGTLAFGTLLAVFADRRIRAESLFRTIFLYPLAVSLIVTGLSWRWVLDPVNGLQGLVRGMGWENFTFDWLTDPNRAIYTLVIAGIWHSAGLIMVIILAGLRGVDEDLWKAIRMEGIPLWRAYLQVIFPGMRPVVASCVVLLMSDVIRGYDLVIAMTKGGPGIATEMPAKFAVDYYFARVNLGLASAASIAMLVLSLLLLAPYFYSEFRRRT